MSNGGYVLIDCNGVDLTKTSIQTKHGIYKTVKNAMCVNKPLYATNLVFGDYGKITPVAIMANMSSTTDIICTSSTLQIIISENDNITINNMVGSE